MNGHFDSSMRWEGGLIAYFNVLWHYNFPTHSFQVNSFPPWKRFRSTMQCQMRDENANQCNSMKKGCHAATSRTVLTRDFPLSSHGEKGSDSPVFGFAFSIHVVCTKISQINYLIPCDSIYPYTCDISYVDLNAYIYIYICFV